MKKVGTFCFAVLFPFFLFSQRKTKNDTQSFIRFGHATIRIQNDFITDSGRKVSPTFISYPFTVEAFSVTGPRLTVSIMDMDSTEYFTGGMNGVLIDTAQSDKYLFSLLNLQVRISHNDGEDTSWKETTSFPVSAIDPSEAIVKPGNPNYTLLNDTIQVNGKVSIEIRNRQKPDVIFRMHFTRTALPVMPFLAMMLQDSSTVRSETEFIRLALERGNNEFKSINSFYKNWPEKYGKGDNNQAYFSSTKLAFYFRKYSDQYPDSSLQYALLINNDKDTSWHTSGHLILLTKLKDDTRYQLLVRYKEAPSNIWQSRFYVPPVWYQTSLFYTAASLLAGLTGVFVVFFIVHRRKLKMEKEKLKVLQLDQRAVRSQLNPHFTFNALSSIQSLMNQGRIEEANYYFTDFSSLLRSSLHNHKKELTALQEELATLEQYIKLEQLRFPFQYSVSVDDTINSSAVEVPSLLLQPLVENAIRHGISGLQGNGLLTITVKNDNQNLLITVRDNGPGFIQKETDGYGLSLTKERIHLLNQTLKEQKIELSIDDSPAGTAVLLSFEDWL